MSLVITGSENINMVRLIALKHALKLEIMGLKRHGRPASAIIRDELKSKTRNKKALLIDFESYINQVSSKAYLE